MSVRQLALHTWVALNFEGQQKERTTEACSQRRMIILLPAKRLLAFPFVARLRCRTALRWQA